MILLGVSAMTDISYSFKCNEYVKNDDGTVNHYILEVIDAVIGISERFSVVPSHLVSVRSMKKILLGRKILYAVPQRKHERMLIDLFAIQPEAR